MKITEETLWEKIQTRGFSRRDFLEFCGVMTASLGLKAGAFGSIVEALETKARPPVLCCISRNARAAANRSSSQPIRSSRTSFSTRSRSISARSSRPRRAPRQRRFSGTRSKKPRELHPDGRRIGSHQGRGGVLHRRWKNLSRHPQRSRGGCQGDHRLGKLRDQRLCPGRQAQSDPGHPDPQACRRGRQRARLSPTSPKSWLGSSSIFSLSAVFPNSILSDGPRRSIRPGLRLLLSEALL